MIIKNGEALLSLHVAMAPDKWNIINSEESDDIVLRN